MNIVLTKRSDDWHAHFTGIFGAGKKYLGCGKTQNAAIADLVLTHYQETRVHVSVRKINAFEYVAEIFTDGRKWEAARTQSDAVGKLVRGYMETFGVSAIEYADDAYTQRHANTQEVAMR